MSCDVLPGRGLHFGVVYCRSERKNTSILNFNCFPAVLFILIFKISIKRLTFGLYNSTFFFIARFCRVFFLVKRPFYFLFGSVCRMTELTEEAIAGAALNEPLEQHILPALRWWLLCHSIQISSSLKKFQVMEK